MSALTVALVDPAATLELRQQVLRPHQTVAEMAAETDVDAMFAIAALIDGVVTSCALAMPGAPGEHPELSGFSGFPRAAVPWRLRGMATAASYRGKGLGAQVLARVIEEVRVRGGDLLWCHARTPARALYERAGFTVLGHEWEEPMIGPHVLMWLALKA